MTEAEAQRILRAQIAKSARTASQERVMCDSNDYGALRESIVAHLGMLFFAVSGAVAGHGQGQAPLFSARTSTTFLTNPHSYAEASDGDCCDVGTAGGSAQHSNSHSYVSSPSRRPPSGRAAAAPSSSTAVAAQQSTEELTAALQARLTKRTAEAAQRSLSAKAPPPPPIIDMGIARAVCRPGSASAAASASGSAARELLASLTAAAGGGGSSSPRDRGASAAMDTVRRSLAVRDGFNTAGGSANANTPDANDGASPQEGRVERAGRSPLMAAADPDAEAAAEGSAPPLSLVASAGVSVAPLSDTYAQYAKATDEHRARFGLPPAGTPRGARGHTDGEDGTATIAVGDARVLVEASPGDLDALRYGRGGRHRAGSASAVAGQRGGGVLPSSATPRPSSSASVGGAAFRESLSHRPRPPTGTVEVASARIKVAVNTPRQGDAYGPEHITTHAVANAHGVVIVPMDSHRPQQQQGRGQPHHLPTPREGLVLASGCVDDGTPRLVSGEWGVGHSTWSPRSDAQWVGKERKPVSMRPGRR